MPNSYTPAKRKWIEHFQKTRELNPMCSFRDIVRAAPEIWAARLRELGHTDSQIHEMTAKLVDGSREALLAPLKS